MKLTLNVGCGERVFKEYPEGFECVNYDERNLYCVDVTGDVRSLPFSDGEFDYIIASDIIEHFKISEIENILREWRRVLRVGGIMEFRMPNLRAICKKYIDGVHDAKMCSWLLYGGQDYTGNFHYTAFDREWFKLVIEPLGFKEVEYIDEDNNFVMKVQKV